MAANVVLRLPAWQRLIWGVALGAFTLGLLGLVTAGGWGWLGLPAGCLVGTAAVRSWLLRVEVAPEGLVIVNSFRTHRLGWDDVDRAVHEGGVRIRRRAGGREIPVDAFAEPPGVAPCIVRRNARVAATLQQQIVRRRGR